MEKSKLPEEKEREPVEESVLGKKDENDEEEESISAGIYMYAVLLERFPLAGSPEGPYWTQLHYKSNRILSSKKWMRLLSRGFFTWIYEEHQPYVLNKSRLSLIYVLR